MTVLLMDEFSMADSEAWRGQRHLLAPLAAMADEEPPDAPPLGKPQASPPDPEPGPGPAPPPRAAEGPLAEDDGGPPPAAGPPPPGRPRRRRHPREDPIGRSHMIIFVDFKQLPPATVRCA